MLGAHFQQACSLLCPLLPSACGSHSLGWLCLCLSGCCYSKEPWVAGLQNPEILQRHTLILSFSAASERPNSKDRQPCPLTPSLDPSGCPRWGWALCSSMAPLYQFQSSSWPLCASVSSVVRYVVRSIRKLDLWKTLRTIPVFSEHFSVFVKWGEWLSRKDLVFSWQMCLACLILFQSFLWILTNSGILGSNHSE